MLTALLEDCATGVGGIEIVTSILTTVEVAFAAVEQRRRRLDPEQERRIDRLWDDQSPVELAELHEVIAYEARRLMREAITHGWSLKGMDAVHLGTAVWLRADAFHTYDNRLFKYSTLTGFEIAAPKTERPRLPLNEP